MQSYLKRAYFASNFKSMPDFLEIIPAEVKTRDLHQYLLGSVGPRPIALASTISKDGVPNLSPFSFFNVFSARPPIVIFSPARRVRDNTTKDTLSNVYEVPEVVVNIVSHSIVQQMNLSSCEFPSEVDEFKKAGFNALASDLVKPLRVAESPVQLECRLTEIKPLSAQAGAGQLIMAEVVKMHINKAVLGENGYIDPYKIDLVSRMSGNWYAHAQGDALFEVPKPGKEPGIGFDQLPADILGSTTLTGNHLGMLGMIPSLPSEADLEAFRKGEGASLISGLVSDAEKHKAAAQILDEEQAIEKAWKVLLA